MSKQELLIEARRINSKLSAVIDGEQSLPTLYALLALAAHCTRQANVTSDDAVAILHDMLKPSP